MSKTGKRVGGRAWLVGLAGVAVAVAAGVGLWALSGSNEGNAPEPSQQQTETDRPAVLYVEGNVLKEKTSEGEPEEIYEGISAAAIGSPDRSAVAWVAFAGPEKPIAHVYSVGAESVTTFPGAAPMWSPDGNHIAVLRPDPGVKCQAEKCGGRSTIAVVDVGSGDEVFTSRSEEWSLEGWLGDKIMAGTPSDDESTTLLDPASKDGGEAELDLPYKKIRSASPDGRWVITAGDSGPEIYEVDTAAQTVDFSERFGGPDDSLTSIDWQEDELIAVLTNLEETSVVTHPVGSSDEAHRIEVDLDATADVFWAPDGKGFVYTAVDRDVPELHIRYCRLDGSDCVTYVTWQTGTRLIGPLPQA